jgi:hypothetical protein
VICSRSSRLVTGVSPTSGSVAFGMLLIVSRGLIFVCFPSVLSRLCATHLESFLAARDEQFLETSTTEAAGSAGSRGQPRFRTTLLSGAHWLVLSRRAPQSVVGAAAVTHHASLLQRFIQANPEAGLSTFFCVLVRERLLGLHIICNVSSFLVCRATTALLSRHAPPCS